jgi:glucose-6-phosphate isomerase
MPSELHINFSQAGIGLDDIKKYERELQSHIKTMESEASKGYDTDYAFLSTATDKQAIKEADRISKALGRVDILVMVGIGGSNLGTLALAQAIRGSLQHLTTAPALLCADTTDAHAVSDIAQTVRAAAKKKQRTALIVISKSGNTTETIANANILLEALAATGKDWARRVVAITDEGSALWKAAEEKKFLIASIPKRLGGRYSVLSSVGLVPLAVLGIDNKKLLAGAAAMRARCLSTPQSNPAAMLALAQHINAQARRNINEYFVFGSDLEGMGRWYRQLLAESCGKDGKGVTPTVCVGSTDLHSVGQLALGGPDDKFTMFLRAEKEQKVIAPKKPVLNLVPAVNGRELQAIMAAIAQGTAQAYTDAKRPFISMTMRERDEYSLGQLLMLHMAQTVLFARLLKVNPFDQPAVELYKKHTRAILAGK